MAALESWTQMNPTQANRKHQRQIRPLPPTVLYERKLNIMECLGIGARCLTITVMVDQQPERAKTLGHLRVAVGDL